MELKVTKEKVLAAAKDCPDANKTLRTLFPEAFAEEKQVICNNGLTITGGKDVQTIWTNGLNVTGVKEKLLETAYGIAPPDLAGKCFYLGERFNWELRQHLHYKLLIPTRK